MSDNNLILETAKKKYLNGKSFRHITTFLQKQKLDDQAIAEYVGQLHRNFNQERTRRAKKDLYIALGIFALIIPFFILPTISVFLDIPQLFFGIYLGRLGFLLSFVWIPFMKSFYIVKRDRRTFDQISRLFPSSQSL